MKTNQRENIFLLFYENSFLIFFSRALTKKKLFYNNFKISTEKKKTPI